MRRRDVREPADELTDPDAAGVLRQARYRAGVIPRDRRLRREIVERFVDDWLADCELGRRLARKRKEADRLQR